MTFADPVRPLLVVLAMCLPVGAAGGKIPPPKEGKVVLVNPSDSHIAIDTIDGERKGIRSSGVYELAPGAHTIRVHYFSRTGNVVWEGHTFIDYSFTGVAGTVLKIVCDETQKGTTGTWKLWIQDVASGKDVKHLAQAMARGKEAELHEQQLQANYADTLKKAEQGDLQSMYDLGLMYDRGEGVAANPAESMQWFKKASERGHATALFMMGLNYHLGQGVDQNHEEAFVWLSLSAIFGDESAPFFRDESEKELAPEALARAKARIVQLESKIRAQKPVS